MSKSCTLIIQSKSTRSTQQIEFYDIQEAIDCIEELKNTTPNQFQKNEYLISFRISFPAQDIFDFRNREIKDMVDATESDWSLLESLKKAIEQA